jgi:hypothetical protein
MKPPFRISVARMLGFAFLASLLGPPAFGAGITVRFVGEPEAASAVGPWYQEKYGYKEPPKTWEGLAAMAKKIQDGERDKGA